MFCGYNVCMTHDPRVVTLTGEQAQQVGDLVASGRFQSVEEALEHAIRLLAQRESVRAEITRKIQEGLDAVDRGETIGLDEAFADLDQIILDSERRAAG